MFPTSSLISKKKTFLPSFSNFYQMLTIRPRLRADSAGTSFFKIFQNESSAAIFSQFSFLVRFKSHAARQVRKLKNSFLRLFSMTDIEAGTELLSDYHTVVHSQKIKKISSSLFISEILENERRRTRASSELPQTRPKKNRRVQWKRQRWASYCRRYVS